MAPPTLVLSGGNALGAYHEGVWAAFEAAGVEPGWICASSIGAAMAAIIAGNAPDERAAALRHFWEEAAAFDPAASLPALLRAPAQYAQALAVRAFGRAPLFLPRVPAMGHDPAPGQFSTEPMRRLLDGLVDFARLNDGPMRVSVLAVDLADGSEVVFDSAAAPIELDHIMASAALIPDFAPVEVGGRLLGDGGLSANCPVHLVLDEAWHRGERVACFAADLFAPAAPLPRDLLQSTHRQSDLIFSRQTAGLLAGRALAWQGRMPGADVFHVAYEAMQEETALKSYDFSAGTLARRRAAGQADMARAIAAWLACPCDTPGLTVHGQLHA